MSMKFLTHNEPPIPKTGVIDTGKVRIGMQYKPQLHFDVSPDMYRLQTALLSQGRRLSEAAIVVITLAAAALIVFFLR